MLRSVYLPQQWSYAFSLLDKEGNTKSLVKF